MSRQRPEELLRETLRTKALDATSDLTLEHVRRDAAARKRRSAWRTASVAAAAVAIGLPTALYLRPGDENPSPAPSPSPSASLGPTPTQDISPTPTASVLEGIPRGASVGIPWMSSGVIHTPSGPDVPVPVSGTGAWTAFTGYHGGWLLSGDGGVLQVKGNGQAEPVAQSGGGIAVSGDQLQTAFLADDAVRIGITTGMGEGESVIPFRTPDPKGPVGFVSGGRVVCNGLKGQVVLVSPSGDPRPVSGLIRASSSTDSGDLIAGSTVDDDGTAVVVSAATGKVLWTKPQWVTGAFSPDGRHLAAYRTATGGEFETVAILDARTGAVVSDNHGLAALGALPQVPPTAWDQDGTLLIPYRAGSAWTIVRLELDGRMTRATSALAGNPIADHLVFAARP
jgi:hypothetical protein